MDSLDAMLDFVLAHDVITSKGIVKYKSSLWVSEWTFINFTWGFHPRVIFL